MDSLGVELNDETKTSASGNEATYSVAAIAGLFYAGSATMFLAATQTWELHLPRQAFLESSKISLLYAVLITCVEAILIFLAIFPIPQFFMRGVRSAAMFATVLLSLYGGALNYQALKPLEACVRGDNAICIANPAPQ